MTPLQQGLLFHAGTAHGGDDGMYVVQLGITVVGPLDTHRLRDAVEALVTRHPHLVARFCDRFDEPVQIIPADPVPGWRYVELGAAPISMPSMSTSRSSSCAPPNAPRSASWPTSRRSGWR